MKQKFNAFILLTISNFLPYIIILIFLASVYGFNDIFKLGLYSDDWERFNLYKDDTSTRFSDKLFFLIDQYSFSFYRPTSLFILPASALLGVLIKNQIAGMHLLSFLINYINVVLLFILFCKVSNNRLISLLFSIFVFSLPGRSTTLYWPSTQVEMLSITFFLLALNTFLWGAKSPNFYQLLLVFIFSTISALSYEVTFFIPLLFFVMGLSSNNKSLVYFFSSSAAIIIVIVYKFYLYSHTFMLPVIKSLPENNLSLFTIFKNSFYLHINIVNDLGLFTILLHWSKYISNHFLFLFIVSFFTGLLYFKYPSSEHVTVQNSRTLLIIGFVIIVGYSFTMSPIIPTNQDFILFGKFNRFTSIPIVGFGFIICYVLSLFVNNDLKIVKLVGVLLVSVFIYLNLVGLSLERDAYIRSWKIQTAVLNSIDYTPLQNNRSVFVFTRIPRFLMTTDYYVPIFEDYWTLTYALSIYSGNAEVEADISTNPYARLDNFGGYRSNHWNKKYYSQEYIYILDLHNPEPKFIPIRDAKPNYIQL